MKKKDTVGIVQPDTLKGVDLDDEGDVKISTSESTESKNPLPNIKSPV